MVVLILQGNGYWESSCNLLRLQCGLCGLYFRYTPLALLARTNARTHVLVCSAFLFALKCNLHGTSQGHLFGEYPSKLLNTTLQIAFATVQSFLMAFLIERDFARWKLSLDVGLVAIIYCVSIRSLK